MDEFYGPVLAAARNHRHRIAVQSDPWAPSYSHVTL
jgi:hypothetical protein